MIVSNFRLRIILVLLVTCLSLNAKNIDTSKSLNLQYSVKALKNFQQNDVNRIYKDKMGFIWIGTLDGLYRYDGYSYKIYRMQEGKNSLSSNMIIAIDEDAQGNIWLGTYGKGISMINVKTDEITNYSLSVLTNTKTPIDNVSALIIDKNNNIWVGNWYGLIRIRIDSTNQIIKNVKLFRDEKNSSVLRIHEDEHKNLWIATSNKIKRILNPTSDNLKYETFDSHCECICDYQDGILIGGNNFLSVILPNAINKKYYKTTLLNNISATSVVSDNNNIWLGNREGVSLLKYQNNKWEIEKTFNKSNNTAFSSNIVTSLSLHNNGLFVGTRGAGVITIKKTEKRFNNFYKTNQRGSLFNNLTRAMYEDSHQNLWIGDEEAGVSFLKKGNSYENGFVQISVNDNTNDRAYVFKETLATGKNKKNIMWVGTSYFKALVAIDINTLKPIPQPVKISNSLGFVFSIEKVGENTLWVGSYERGLWRLKINDVGVIESAKQFMPNDNKNGVISHIIRSILLDKDGDLWISTDRGLNRIRKTELEKENPFFESFNSGKYNFNINRHYLLQLLEAGNKIWIGSMGGGLINYDKKNNTFSSITTADGLPSNTVKSIQESNGILWLSTNAGITKYNPQTNNIVNYDKDDNLIENEFSEICSVKRADGTILFGSNKGVTYFNPKEILTEKTLPILFFSDLKIDNQSVKVGKLYENRIILTQTIEKTKEINLKYSENNFSISFTGLHFNNASKDKFKYMLEGFDKKWIHASSSYRTAQYTNIHEGVYYFKVLGANSDNIWNVEPIVLKIKIDPPFSRSILARILYLFVLILLAYIAYKISNSFIIKRKQLIISKIEKENAEKLVQYKLQFFTNISHEFKTPLTLITIPLEQLISNKTLDEETRYKHLSIIKKNANVLLKLIEELLDFRKIENNKMTLKLSLIDINNFVESICNAFIPLAEKMEIDFIVEKTIEPLIVPIDIQLFEKVIFNLLSNAFKFTPLNGHISVSIEINSSKSELKIIVKDDGAGISENVSGKIFDRYFQGNEKDSTLQSGTGIGLSLSKEIVVLHGGELNFKNNHTGGSSFIISLTINKMEESSKPNLVENYQFSTNLNSGFDVSIIKNKSLESQKKSLPKLLIVEDNDDLRDQLYLALKDEYQIIMAENGEKGYHICKKEYPNIIVSDVVMPKMSGIEMCDKIKTDEEISHIPLLILTAKNSIESQLESFSNGADAYLGKPFNLDVLKQNLISLLHNRELIKNKFQNGIDIDFEALANSSADHKFLDAIWKIVNDNLENSEFSIEDLASKYGVSRIYLNRKIKALTGETSNQFLRNIRLKYAAELIAKSDLSISEVTWKVGYNDLNTFRTRFKEKYGVNPSDYKTHISES